MKNLWIGMLALMMAFCLGSCREKSDQPATGEGTEQVAETPSLEDIVAKAKAEGANWTTDDWKTNIKAAMTAIAPMFKKIGEMQKQVGDDPEKAAAALGDLAKLMEEMEPMDKLFDQLDSIAQTSEIGKAVMADTVFQKQVAEELGIADIDI